MSRFPLRRRRRPLPPLGHHGSSASLREEPTSPFLLGGELIVISGFDSAMRHRAASFPGELSMIDCKQRTISTAYFVHPLRPEWSSNSVVPVVTSQNVFYVLSKGQKAGTELTRSKSVGMSTPLEARQPVEPAPDATPPAPAPAAAVERKTRTPSPEKPQSSLSPPVRLENPKEEDPQKSPPNARTKPPQVPKKPRISLSSSSSDDDAIFRAQEAAMPAEKTSPKASRSPPLQRPIPEPTRSRAPGPSASQQLSSTTSLSTTTTRQFHRSGATIKIEAPTPTKVVPPTPPSSPTKQPTPPPPSAPVTASEKKQGYRSQTRHSLRDDECQVRCQQTTLCNSKTIQATIDEERRELQELNTRFERYISKVDGLDVKNERLIEELLKIRSRVRQLFEEKRDLERELAIARSLVDEASDKRSESEVLIQKKQRDSADWRRKYDNILDERARDQLQIIKLEQGIRDTDNESEQFRQRIPELLDHIQRLQEQIVRKEDELNKLRDLCDQEIETRLKLTNRVHTLDEEKHFLQNVHQKEASILSAFSQSTMDDNEFFAHELEESLRMIRHEYEHRLREDELSLKKMYCTRIEEWKRMAEHEKRARDLEKSELHYQREMRKRLSQENENDRLKKEKLEQQLRKLLEERDRVRFENQGKLEQLNADTANMLYERDKRARDAEEMLKLKNILEGEVAIYRKLVDTLEKRKKEDCPPPRFPSILDTVQTPSSGGRGGGSPAAAGGSHQYAGSVTEIFSSNRDTVQQQQYSSRSIPIAVSSRLRDGSPSVYQSSEPQKRVDGEKSSRV